MFIYSRCVFVCVNDDILSCFKYLYLSRITVLVKKRAKGDPNVRDEN